MGWSLAEAAIDYMHPKGGGETDITNYPKPPGIHADARVAIRRDFNCFTTRSTWKDGPFWHQVFRRLTYGEDGQLIFDDEITDNMSFDDIHKKFDPMQHTLETHLWYMPESVEGVKPRKPAKVEMPSKKEIAEHEGQNHAVYRNWCETCIRARSTGSVHRKRSEAEKGDDGPTAHCDFFFLQSAPFLAMRMMPSGRYQAVALLDKSNSEYAQKAMVRFIKESGHKRLVFKSDNEPALVAIKESAASKMADVEVIQRNSPVGDHQANGMIEVSVRELKRQMRALRMSLESKLKMTLDNNHPLVAWISSFAAEALNVFRKDASGKTAYEKEFSRKWTKPCLEYGEKIYIREANEKDGRLDWEPMSVAVRFIGHHARTNSVMGLSEDGLKIGQAVKRLPFDQRWTQDGIDEISGYPWDVKSRSRSSAGTHVKRVEAPSREVVRLPPPIDDLPGLGRSFYVMKADVEKHGFTAGCRGCAAVQQGGAAVAHDSKCRTRIMGLVDQDRVKRHADRREARAEVRDEEKKRRELDDAKPAGESEQKVRKVRFDLAVGSNIEEEENKRRDDGQMSPPSSPTKKQKKQSHASQKRAPETPVQELDPATTGADMPEVIQLEVDPPTAAVGANDVTLEDVLGGGTSSLPSATTSSPTSLRSTSQQNPADDISSLDIVDYDIYMSDTKWKGIEALDIVERQIEARKAQLGAVDVAEIFSPPRFTKGAPHLGLNPGFAVDLQTGWDLDNEEDLKALDELIELQDPFLLTGSPRCDPFSVLRNLNKKRLNDPKHLEARARGVRHLHLCVEKYKERHKRGKYFLHEHPAQADSWDDAEVIALQRLPGVYTVVGPMCAWGMKLYSPRQGQGLVYKPTKFITNSIEIAKILDKHCLNRRGGPVHRHISLIGGLAHLCAEYPKELVNAVLEGIKWQMMKDNLLNSVEVFSSGPVPSDPTFDDEWQEKVDEFFDDISGEALPADGVREARMEEIEWIRKIKLYDKVPRQVAIDRGKQILPVRWVDVNKGDKQKMKLRSRIVGKELKAKTKEALLAHELFSATPPWEMIKSLFSLLVTDPKDDDGRDQVRARQELVMGVFDISRAHFMPEAKRELYVEIPDEDRLEGEEDFVGRLNRGMYGFRDASHAWMEDWQKVLSGGGFTVGVANPALFLNEQDNCRGAVHGDDFYVLGPTYAVDKVKNLLGDKYQMRESHRLGFTSGCSQSATVLNRVVSLGETDGRRWVKIEPDKRHVELIVQGVGLSMKSAGVTTPSVKQTDAQAIALETSADLSPRDASRYRSGVMRASFLAQERADIAEAVKRMAQGMSRPKVAHWELLKRLARYLIKYPNVCLVYRQQKMPDFLRIAVDSDFAGDKAGRRSTTGMMVQYFGSHVLKASSNLQSVLGLNVSEAEYYALTHGAAHGLGMQSYFQDIGLSLGVVLESDSSSAKSFASRQGLGKQRHVQVRYLWLQQAVAKHNVVIRKINTKHNVSDILTKSSDSTTISKHMLQMGLESHEPDAALQKTIH
eukprot:s170_g8.t1